MAEYIEREALREILDGWRDAHADVDDVHGCGLLEDVICEIDAQTAADVAPVVHGRWIEKSAPARKIYFECSHCGAQENKHTAIKGYYCWRCGAKMDGGADHEAD